MAKAKKKTKVEKPKGAVPDDAYVIGLTASVDTVVKGVAFKNGVGVLDYPGLAACSGGNWFKIVDGFLVQVDGFKLEVLTEHFTNEHSAKITRVTPEVAAKLKNDISRGEIIAAKYYKVSPIEAEVSEAPKSKPRKPKESPPVNLTDSDLSDSSEGDTHKKINSDEEPEDDGGKS